MIVNVYLNSEGKLIYWVVENKERYITLFPPTNWKECWEVEVWAVNKNPSTSKQEYFSRFSEAMNYFISLVDIDMFEYIIIPSPIIIDTVPTSWEPETPKPTNITNRKLQLP